ncbi:ABC transporter ATP-binding protein [Sneathiella sp. HT1-7]|uniref:ABC transporter ATP-binding protein n=1 Tax=Sneathiella sp. HT1-7 TaxID=2887192 RepID=UPI001D133EB5|nr:ABC transporter ATP-binding protein [Sneathiella sp. HT1-7]MCC3306399.1 ABC transporter ATP-binding protein [Sneathiella sp. HT1-7]
MERLSMIELLGISKSYGRKKALEGISLTLSNGQCLALVGHNGAGKTTLIKIILGLLKPSNGSVAVLHGDPGNRSFNRNRRHIGFLPEQVLFQKTLTGRETLAFYARLKGLSVKTLDTYFERVDLLGAADRRVGTYSKGMRQRLGIAQALLGQPKLLILDEPTSGLDPVARQNIYKILDEEKRKGAAVLISSHVLTELDDRIDRVAILNDGKLVAQGSIPTLRHQIGMHSQMKISADREICRELMTMFQNEIPARSQFAGEVILTCPPARKVEILGKVMAFRGRIQDIELTDPTLEQVFNAYSTSDHSAGELSDA